MDKSKHTVTIPFEDYNELISQEDMYILFKEHFQVMINAGIFKSGSFDLTKKPKSVGINNSPQTYGVYEPFPTINIKFEY